MGAPETITLQNKRDAPEAEEAKQTDGVIDKPFNRGVIQGNSIPNL